MTTDAIGWYRPSKTFIRSRLKITISTHYTTLHRKAAYGLTCQGVVGVCGPGHNLETVIEVLDDLPQFWMVPHDVIDLGTRVVCAHQCNALRSSSNADGE